MGSGGSVRSFGPIRSVVVSVVLGLFAASCAADPSLTDEVAVEASDAATSGTDVAEADDAADDTAPEPATDDDGTDADASDDAPSDEPEAEAPAVRFGQLVTWLDTEFRIPGLWSLLATDGGAILLEHPRAAGPGGSVYVSMVAADGRPSAEQLGAVPHIMAGEVMETRELDAVFATGGPGLQVGASTSQVVTIYSDTGISISISRDEGTLTEEAVATVLALLATIEPPTVTPSPWVGGIPVTPPPPASPSLPRRETVFGPPYPVDPPVAVDPALPLIQVRDFPQPDDRCFRNGVEYSCDDPAYQADGGFFTMPHRSWTYLLPSVAAIEPVCADLLARAVAAGGTFSSYLPAEQQCVISTAHGARIASIHIYLPDGSLLEAQSRRDLIWPRDLGACGEPCPVLVVEVKFP